MNWRWLPLGAVSAGIIAVVVLWLGRSSQPVTPITAAAGPANSCRLPVYLAGSRIGGFLSVPGYRFTPDPGAPDASQSYDAVLHKWLAVDPRLVSRDGNWWAYQTPKDQTSTTRPAIHLVDHHGVDRTVWSGMGIVSLIGWTELGVVFVHASADSHSVAEFWVAQIPSGTLRSLPSATGEPVGVDADGGLWTMQETSESVPSLRWTLSRTDLANGATVTWWDGKIPGLIQLLGFDVNQHPVLRILPDAEYHDRVVALTMPKTEVEIVHDGAAINFSPASTLGDQHGIWFGDPRSGVWQWTPRDGLRRVAQLNRTLDQVDVAEIAGPCL